MAVKKQREKMFIVKKYVLAESASKALRKEKNQDADDVWVDDDWRKANVDNLAEAIGFRFVGQDYS